MADTGENTPAPAGTPAETAAPVGDGGGTGRRVARLAKRVRSFAAAHGGAAGTEGQIAYLGARGHRLVLVGADGAWGDVVAPSRADLADAAEAAGVTLREALDGETAARLRTGPYEWSRMAGIQIGGGRHTA
ncbi:hypothetical protein [Streptomyces avicenniae]|uniref:hypothetical protein n=1 Tax=Streptomyces avicenniae TaxID=500153 RepID=UPI000A6C0F19|nr:hypothetical protein [Streptomyces avicenniae]